MIADIEDFGQLMMIAYNWYVAVTEISLPVYIGEIIKISSPVQRICCGCYIDSTKLIYDAFTR
jgi:hypothetical protein